MNKLHVQARINRAKELLNVHVARHAAMATVNANGSPHNTPFHLILDDQLKHVYFGSHRESVHTQNVLRTGQIFVVVYDALKRGGLYIRAENGHELIGEELEEGWMTHNKIRGREGKKPIPAEYYGLDTDQHMYRADIKQMWVNVEERDPASGLMLREVRYEVSAKNLLG